MPSALVKEDGAGGVEIFYTNYTALVGDVRGSERERALLLSALRHEVVPDGMPFFLLADGTYKTRLNAFLSALPSLRVRSPAYATDLLTWARFLRESRCRRLAVMRTTSSPIPSVGARRRGLGLTWRCATFGKVTP